MWNYAWDSKYGPTWFSAYKPELAQAALDDFRTEIKSSICQGRPPTTPLVDVLSDNMAVFNGFGKHTAHDVLHELGIFPLMPVSCLALDDVLYDSFCKGLRKYTGLFDSSSFLRLVAGECNSNNPFTFHHTSNEHYISSFVRVYRRKTVRLPQALYVDYVTRGLLDETHTIGKSASLQVNEIHSGI